MCATMNFFFFLILLIRLRRCRIYLSDRRVFISFKIYGNVYHRNVAANLRSCCSNVFFFIALKLSKFHCWLQFMVFANELRFEVFHISCSGLASEWLDRGSWSPQFENRKNPRALFAFERDAMKCHFIKVHAGRSGMNRTMLKEICMSQRRIIFNPVDWILCLIASITLTIYGEHSKESIYIQNKQLLQMHI